MWYPIVLSYWLKRKKKKKYHLPNKEVFDKIHLSKSRFVSSRLSERTFFPSVNCQSCSVAILYHVSCHLFSGKADLLVKFIKENFFCKQGVCQGWNRLLNQGSSVLAGTDQVISN